MMTNYYPEDIEDLIIKNGENVIEAVQVKNISSALTISSLASTKTSKSGEGFLNECVVYMHNIRNSSVLK